MVMRDLSGTFGPLIAASLTNFVSVETKIVTVQGVTLFSRFVD